jgi:exosortase
VGRPCGGANRQLPSETDSVLNPHFNVQTQPTRRHLYFCLFVAVSSLAFWVPISQLIAFSLTHDYGSHILLIVPVSVCLIYLKRDEIFSDLRVNLVAGSILFALGLILALAAHRYSPLRREMLSVESLALVVLWIAGFILCYGTGAFMRAQFPLLFLLLLVPIPEIAVEKAIFALQAGSSNVAYGLLQMLSIPVLKDGFVLLLPRVDLEVAKECSGIRSSLSLLVTLLVVGQFILRSPWRKLLLVLASVPLLVIKNGIRIVTIYMLTTYVNPGFLHGKLHTSGGILFYLLGLLALIPVVVLLRRGENEGLKTSVMPDLAGATST